MLGDWIEYRMHRLENSRVIKGVNESVLHWFAHIEKMKNDRIAKRMYVGKCVGSHLVH